MMKAKRSTLRKKRITRYVEIAAIVLMITAIASVAVLTYNPNTPPEKPKLKAVDYFAFSGLGAEYESVANTDRIIKISVVYLTVTPIGGNATSFHIDPGGYTDPLDYWYPEIKNGTSQVMEVQLSQQVSSTKNGTIYPMKIFVYCSEAEGYVTLQIPETSVFPV
jgi:hypothetical protein